MPGESSDAARRVPANGPEDGSGGGAGAALIAAQGLGRAVSRAEGPAVGRRRVRRRGDRARRRVVLHRGVPDQPADPRRRSSDHAADPEGARARCRSRCTAPGPKPPGPGRASRTRWRNERHQIWPSQIGYPGPDRLQDRREGRGRTRSPRRRCCRSTRTASRRCRSTPSGKTYAGRHEADAAAQHDLRVQRHVPGPDDQRRVRQAGAVRFENHLDENPLNLDRQDFGAPDYSFLTHLHNGHTAPESDGNPHYSMTSRPEAPGLQAEGCGSTTCT